jgi:hypothetical protein
MIIGAFNKAGFSNVENTLGNVGPGTLIQAAKP